VVPLDCKDSQL